MENEKILIFKGVTLHESDREILSNPSYISDEIIQFYFRYLMHTYEKDDILFVSPTVSFMLANSTDSEGIKHSAESLKLREKNLIFFTVNNTINNEEISTTTTDDKQEGTHWSLLVYYRPFHMFIHHDSIRGTNLSNAIHLCKIVKGFVSDDDDDDLVILTRPAKIRKKNRQEFTAALDKVEDEAVLTDWLFTPQQENWYDCGLYVMKIAAVICEWYVTLSEGEKELKEGMGMWSDVMHDKVEKVYVENQMRADILEFVDLLMENADEEDLS